MTVLLLNPGARSGDGADDAEEALAKAGVELHATYAVRPDDLRALLRRLIPVESMVIVGGGDGTLSLAAQELARTETAMGVLPMGTQNSFARSLGIPLDLDGAAVAIAHGTTQRVDLGMIGQRIFTHSVTIGVSTEVAKETDAAFKRVAGQAAYVLTGSKVLAGHEPFVCHLRLDGQERSVETHQVVVTNGGLLGPAELAPEARPDDHLLHVATIGSGSRWEFVRGWAASMTGADLPEGSERFQAREVDLRTEPAKQVDVDGEPGPRTPVRLRVLPGGLRVIVPS